jgi:hypothetical protein
MRRIHSSGRRRFSETDQTAQLLAERLAAVERVMVEQQERIAQQENELANLRGAAGEAPAERGLILPASAREQKSAHTSPRASRRSLLKMGGAAAAAGVAASALALTSGEGAQAAGRAKMRPFTSNPWTTSSFTADAETVVTPSSGSYSANDILQVQYGTGSVYSALSSLKAAISGYDTTGSNIGLYGTSSAGYGLMGVTDAGTGAAGLKGSASSTGTGVLGLSSTGVGVSGTSASGLGGTFSGGQAPIALAAGGTDGPPTGGNHIVGEIYLDNVNTLWLCIFPGNPGNWTRLVASAGSTNFPTGVPYFLSAPFRVFDTRGGVGAQGGSGPMSVGQIITVQVTGIANPKVAADVVPSGATGIIGDLIAIAPSASGFLGIQPSTTAHDPYAWVNYQSGATIHNSVVIGLSGGGAVDIECSQGQTGAGLTITGFLI